MSKHTDPGRDSMIRGIPWRQRGSVFHRGVIDEMPIEVGRARCNERATPARWL
jgi:hypothetical protein